MVSTTTGCQNVAVGHCTMTQNITGDGNTALGYLALFCNNGSTPDFNVAVGRQALYSTTSGYRNVGIGLNAMYSTTTGYTNVAIGAKCYVH